ncbi:MAG TPA: PPC domain-containing DNA-binding protein [Verrucomicrobiae bacterium]|nr:PPC domain-containing DNA-binding protein [Verrucomicrobiae bacterium]
MNETPKTIAIIFNSGDEVMEGLKKVAREYKLAASHFTAIGAFEKVTLGFFDLAKKDYQKTVISEQVEVLSLIGDISLKDAEPEIHAHVVVGKSDCTTRGGHLVNGIVRPTLEVVLTESPLHLHRKFNSEFGLALIDIKES